jgi:hypothetical protein
VLADDGCGEGREPLAVARRQSGRDRQAPRRGPRDRRRPRRRAAGRTRRPRRRRHHLLGRRGRLRRARRGRRRRRRRHRPPLGQAGPVRHPRPGHAAPRPQPSARLDPGRLGRRSGHDPPRSPADASSSRPDREHPRGRSRGNGTVSSIRLSISPHPVRLRGHHPKRRTR